MPSSEPLAAARFFAAIIGWLVKAMVASWFGRGQSPRIGEALARIREMQQLFQRLADLVAAGPGALQLLAENHRPQTPTPQQAAPEIRPAPQARAERQRYARAPAAKPPDESADPGGTGAGGVRSPAPPPAPARYRPPPRNAPGTLPIGLGRLRAPPKPA